MKFLRSVVNNMRLHQNGFTASYMYAKYSIMLK
jgi:hypothetical protein